MYKTKHIEVKGCIINITEGLSDRQDREVTHIEILPDNHCIGERIWKLQGNVNNRVIRLKKKLSV